MLAIGILAMLSAGVAVISLGGTEGDTSTTKISANVRVLALRI